MDEQKFVELLKAIQIPDTEKVKAATAELRAQFYPHPESLLLLFKILVTNPAQEIRQQAAVEAHRLVPKHWKDISGSEKPAIRSQLLQSTLNEGAKLVRHSAARVIASIASEDLEDGEWAELPNLLHRASVSPEVAHREVGVYILFTLLEASPMTFQETLPDLFAIFDKTIKDPESVDVRINTLLCLGTTASLIDNDTRPEHVDLFVQIFPGMVGVLKAVVDTGADDEIIQAFEVFQELLNYDSALLSPHFNELLNFMLEIAVNREIADESRTQAISFLMQCIRWRKMKIQGTRGLGENLTLKCIEIATELDYDDGDEDDELTPSRSALALLEMLAASLPPRQVIVPLLSALPSYVNHQDPKFRQAGILSLSVCVEGAPDFVNTQLDSLLPTVMKLLNDPVVGVRNAALNGVARLADEISEPMSKYHEQLIPALIKNLDAAIATAVSEQGASNQKNLNVLKAACAALASLTEGMEKEVMLPYLEQLMIRFSQLLQHPNFDVKSSAVNAIGAIASASEDAFLPYFQKVIPALEPYMELKDGDDELELRSNVSDALGSMADAIGAEAFLPYLDPLMKASEQGLSLGHPRLKETSYILWSTMVKVFEDKFTPYLPGVVKSLFDCLEQQESDLEVELGEDATDIVGKEVTIAGMKVKVASAKDTADDLDIIEEDDDGEWDDLNAITGVALEKEVAVEVLADVLTHTKHNFVPYFEKTVELVMGLVEHQYEDLRKAAISTLWRAYTCLWALMEDSTGVKWSPGLPLKTQPTAELLKMGEVVTTATLSCWEDENDRSVVTDINRNVAATLKACGPAVLAQEKFLERTISVITAIITRSHPCQQDMGFEEEEPEDLEEESEYDWLVIDTALDVVIGLSTALGPTFSELWKVFQKPIMKFASSATAYERSTSIGVIAECTRHMGAGVTPSTSTLLKLLLHRLSDEDPETKSNAAYAIGLLIFNSEDPASYLPSYGTILQKLEPLLHTQRARTMDNAAGCVGRMIMAHQDKIPLDGILPALIELLPLKEDYEENKPIYECISGLYQAEQPTIIGLTPQLLPIFAAVLSPPEEQLEPETRHTIVQLVKFIAGKNADLIKGNDVLVAAAHS